MHPLFRNNSAALRLLAQQSFTPATSLALPVDFACPRSMAEYAHARAWCRAQCAGKWRCEPDRAAGLSVFRFEVQGDGLLFRLSTPNAQPHP